MYGFFQKRIANNLLSVDYLTIVKKWMNENIQLRMTLVLDPCIVQNHPKMDEFSISYS